MKYKLKELWIVLCIILLLHSFISVFAQDTLPSPTPQRPNEGRFLYILKELFLRSDPATPNDVGLIIVSLLVLILIGFVVALLTKNIRNFLQPNTYRIISTIIIFILFGIPHYITNSSSIIFRKIWHWNPVVFDASFTYVPHLIYIIIFLILWYFIVSSVFVIWKISKKKLNKFYINFIQ